MNRRDSLKSLVFGSIGVGVLLEGCVSGVDSETVANSLKKFNYGRTPEEKEYDKLLFSKKCFTNNQMKLISEISNLILPPNEFGSINDAEVPELIEFMAKDIPSYEAPLKDGLASLNQHSNKKFKKVTKSDYDDLLPAQKRMFDAAKRLGLIAAASKSGGMLSKTGAVTVFDPTTYERVPRKELQVNMFMPSRKEKFKPNPSDRQS